MACFALGAVPALGQVLSDPSLTLTTVVSGLSAPTTMAFVGAGDILVLQKNDGQVRRVLNGNLQAAPVLDLPVNSDSESGLLGIAVDGQSPPGVFLYLTEAVSDGDEPLGNRVYRYTWNSGSARSRTRSWSSTCR